MSAEHARNRLSDLGSPDGHRRLASSSGRGVEAYELHSVLRMNGTHHESTARIDRNELRSLLDTMTPVTQQAITARVRISDVEAALEPAAPKRTYPRPISQVASLLPTSEATRYPRTTRPLMTVRAISQSDSLAVAKPKRASSVAEVRAKLDRGEEIAVPSRPVLSAQVAAELSTEEIAMLPAEVQATLPVVAPEPPPELPIELMPVPVVPVVDPPRFTTIFASFVAAFLVAFCAAYLLV